MVNNLHKIVGYFAPFSLMFNFNKVIFKQLIVDMQKREDINIENTDRHNRDVNIIATLNSQIMSAVFEMENVVERMKKSKKNLR